jgi:hypothetical protein
LPIQQPTKVPDAYARPLEHRSKGAQLGGVLINPAQYPLRSESAITLLVRAAVGEADPLARLGGHGRPQRLIPQNENRRPESSAALGAVPPTDKKHG